MPTSSQNELPLGPHGGDVEVVAQHLGVSVDSILDLSASLNPFPPPIEELVVVHRSAVFRYSHAAYAEAVLAEHLEVEPALVVLTNGGSEAISLLAQLWPKGWVEEPEFSLYRRHLRLLDPQEPRWRSNPHSPSGELITNPTQDLKYQHVQVWDEAYWPMTTGTWTSGVHRQGAVVLGSLTKLWACPGLRLGYIIAPNADLAQQLRNLQPRWSVSALAAAVMSDALAITNLETTAHAITEAKANLVSALEERNLTLESHEAPWVLIHQAASWRPQLANQGVLVRDCTSFGFSDTVRIAIPTAAGLEQLLRAIDIVLDFENN